MLVTGIDIIEIPRIQRVIDHYGDRFLKRIYTPQELEFCNGKANRLAARFAAKEAASKALGLGIRGIAWKEIEVVRQRGHPPALKLHGRAAKRAEFLNIIQLSISISHSREYAVASVVGWREAET